MSMMAERQVTVALLMPAAGEGRRLGLDVPKALAEIAGRPMVCRTLEAFAGLAGLVEVVVLAPETARQPFASALSATRWDGVVPRVVIGGATRQESVRVGLEALQASPEIVCIHDAARPLATPAIVSAVVTAAASRGAATAAARPVDSLRQDDGHGDTRAIDRSTVWLVQTPQAFSLPLLSEAHRRAKREGVSATDDASLVERLCHARVAVVPNDTPNLKVTTAADLACARALYR
jgi:2-C-methyl-D-erythritol 4-phosphate cytidylyltransferase